MPVVIPEAGTRPGELDLILPQGLTQTFRQTWRNPVYPWDPDTAYSTNNVVKYNETWWRAMRSNTNVTPVAGADWQPTTKAQPMDLTGYKVRVTIRKKVTDSEALLTFSTDEAGPLGSQINWVNQDEGVIDLKFRDKDMAALPLMEKTPTDKRGYWDEELENPAGEVDLKLRGRVEVSWEVSR